ncbi:hypothetical protein ACJMK2_036735 [Sinanodonta woodiana]|uniref:Uncharacterized protein n=1 Tax=Sinanodonta woodiana TaxID=1069815 RepID=A0ABD3WMA0_SINWO
MQYPVTLITTPSYVSSLWQPFTVFELSREKMLGFLVCKNCRIVTTTIITSIGTNTPDTVDKEKAVPGSMKNIKNKQTMENHRYFEAFKP